MQGAVVYSHIPFFSLYMLAALHGQPRLLSLMTAQIVKTGYAALNRKAHLCNLEGGKKDPACQRTILAQLCMVDCARFSGAA